MKKKFLIIFYFIITCLGIIHFFYWINRRKKIVITYHNVISDEFFDNSHHLVVSHSESIFEDQIKLIKRRFISDSGENRCLITFDDGYKNQIEIAANILNRHDVKGIFFVSFQSIHTGCALLIDKLMMWVSYVPVGNYKILDINIELTNNNRSLIASNIYNHLLVNYKLWDELDDSLNRAFPFDDLHIDSNLFRLRFKPLEIVDLQILAKDGHKVGCHSWSHRPLSTLPVDAQNEDFNKCTFFVRQYCNTTLYSYPFGSYEEVSPLTVKLCAEYGFSSAYGNIPETSIWPEVNANYFLPRFSLPNERNKFLLEAKLSGFETFLIKLFNMKRQSKYIQMESI